MQEEISFGTWLRKQRRALDLSQQALAQKVGCAKVTLRRIEAGTLKPSKELASILLEQLGIAKTALPQWISFARGLSGFPLQPISASNKPITNRPALLTTFIGRRKEQSDIIKLITKHRLITLTGPGGVGKTRLSLKVIEQILSKYPDGVWLVELAPILDPLLVPRTTAMAIGLRDEPQRPVIDMLCDYLRYKKMVLVLDNCEHLVDACARMVDRILHATPDMRILATSREALGIEGEVIYPIPSLELPDMSNLPSLEILSQYEAVKLFIHRAAFAVPTFTVTNANAPALAQVCHQLDGIPLAIELAAAKIRVLSVEQIAKRLNDRFRLLTGGSRMVLERHQTLRATIDWSYNLLSAAEQALLQKLSVFVGGWTLEAAEEVGAGGLIKSEDVLHLLEQLINKSVVIVEEVGHESRYHMLETIRQYANEKLVESGESGSLRDQHLEYFRALAEQAKPHLISAQQSVWLDRLETELDNIRAALRWAQEGGSVAAGMHLVVDLLLYWFFRVYFRESALALENLLAKPLPVDQIQLLAQAHQVAGWLEIYTGDPAVVLAHAQESERLSLQLGSAGRADLARARNLLIDIQLDHEHDPIRALETIKENLKLLQEVGDLWEMAQAIGAMGNALRQTGDLAGARQAIEQSMVLFRKCGDQVRACQGNTALALFALNEDNYEEARTRCEANLSFYRRASVILGIVEQLWILGATAIREGNYASAKAFYTECLLFDQQIGRPTSQLAECLIGFAGIANAKKHFERSARLLGAAETQIEARKSIPLENFDKKEFERLAATLREKLGDAKFDAGVLEGRGMTMEQAIDLALKPVEER